MLKIKKYDECSYDVISMGEVMLRLDPGDTPVTNAKSFTVWEGGGEYNVSKALSSCFNMRTAVLTCFADNDIGTLILNMIRSSGVDTKYIKLKQFDGIGKKIRNGLNFTERGLGLRSGKGTYDRGNSAASQIEPDDFDFEQLFGEKGVRIFHTGGIFVSLSPNCAKTALKAIKTAKKHGTLVSFDCNFRPSMWQEKDGKDEILKLYRECLMLSDIVIGGIDDFRQRLGVKCDDNTIESVLLEAARQFPSFKVIASTKRKVYDAAQNDWSALLCAEGRLHRSKELKSVKIYDRVGGGDGFASGLLYGLLTEKTYEEALNYGVCHGGLVMTTPGDTSMATLSQVEGLLQNDSRDIKR